MVFLLFVAASIISVVVGLTTGLLWGWVVLTAVCALLLLILAVAKLRRWEPPSGLSPEAQQLFRKYGYFYTARLTYEQYATGSTLTTLPALVLAIVGTAEGFWWVVAYMLVLWLVMYRAAKEFNPSSRLAKGPHSRAHQEIDKRLQKQKKRQRQ